MSSCDVERLEALIEGALPAEDAAETRAHLAACPRCAEELRWLREERRVFGARTEPATPPVPAFSAVLAEVRKETAAHAPASPGARRFRDRAPYDLVFANILLGPLKGLARPIAALAAPGAFVVLSGLLASQANAALAAYRTHGLVLERRIPLEGWMTLVLRRPVLPRPVRRRR